MTFIVLVVHLHEFNLLGDDHFPGDLKSCTVLRLGITHFLYPKVNNGAESGNSEADQFPSAHRPRIRCRSINPPVATCIKIGYTKIGGPSAHLGYKLGANKF